MSVLRHVVDEQRLRFGAGHFAYDARGQAWPVALAERCPALQVGQRKSGLSIAAVSRSDQGEQGRVLCDRQHLAVALLPAARVKRESERLNRAKKYFHVAIPPELGASHRGAFESRVLKARKVEN